MALSSPGIGSNLDVNSIISQLMAVEQRPLTNLSKKEANITAKLSAIGNLKGALASFQTAVKGLSDVSKFQAVRAAVADSTIAGVTGSGTAAPGTYSLEVSKLAQAQKLASAGQSSASTAIGTGTITFEFGTIASGSFDSNTGKYTGASFTSNGAGTKTVKIEPGDNSLSGIRDAINKAGIGVTASIVNDGGTSPYRLVLTQQNTGKASSMKISVQEGGPLAALLNHDPGKAPAEQAFSETMTAQNAEFKVDGIAVSKATNTVSDVITGVTLNLNKTNAGTPTNITVTRDTAAVSSAVTQFVSAYNQINQTLSSLSSYNPETKQAAVLNGDSTVRMIQTQIRGILSAPVEGGGAYTLLSQVGVSLQKNGTLAVDNDKLQKAINSNFSAIASLFASAGKASDSLVSFSSATDKTVPGTYAINITTPATQGKTSAGQDGGGLPIVAGLNIDETNDTLDVKLDGITATIKLDRRVYTSADALAAEIQSKINSVSEFANAGSSVTVAQVGGVLSLTSARYGSASNISINGAGKENLLGATPDINDGVDVAGTIDGATASGSGQNLTGANGSKAEGLKLQITGTSTGNRGTISYAKGYAYQFDKLVESLLASGGPLASRSDGINESLKGLDRQREKINERLEAVEKRYRAQFTSLDVMLSNMTKTSNYLAQQLANLPKIE